MKLTNEPLNNLLDLEKLSYKVYDVKLEEFLDISLEDIVRTKLHYDTEDVLRFAQMEIESILLDLCDHLTEEEKELELYLRKIREITPEQIESIMGLFNDYYSGDEME